MNANDFECNIHLLLQHNATIRKLKPILFLHFIEANHRHHHHSPSSVDVTHRNGIKFPMVKFSNHFNFFLGIFSLGICFIHFEQTIAIMHFDYYCRSISHSLKHLMYLINLYFAFSFFFFFRNFIFILR